MQQYYNYYSEKYLVPCPQFYKEYFILVANARLFRLHGSVFHIIIIDCMQTKYTQSEHAHAYTCNFACAILRAYTLLITSVIRKLCIRNPIYDNNYLPGVRIFRINNWAVMLTAGANNPSNSKSKGNCSPSDITPLVPFRSCRVREYANREENLNSSPVWYMYTKLMKINVAML